MSVLLGAGASRPLVGHARARRASQTTLVAAAYTSASLALFHGVLGDLSNRAPQAGTGDVAQMAWFQSWTAWAIIHGHDPLVSHAMNVPHGVNLMWNTAMPLAGVVMAPITIALGALATVNVLFIVGPISTALTARWWLSRHVSSVLARTVGGAAVGFGPFVAAHLGGHLNFTLLTLVPVILRLGEDVLWRAEARRRPAILLGLVVAAQGLLSEEVLLLLAAGAVVLLVATLVCVPSARHLPSRAVVRGMAMSAAVGAAVLAWPLGVQLLGPDRVHGVNTARYFAQFRDFVVPSDHELFGSSAQTQHLIARGSNPFEDAVYLGVPALALLVVSVAVYRRRHLAWVGLLSGVLISLLAFGSGAHGAFWTGPSHPFAPLLAPPVLSSIVPQRFGLLLDLLAAYWLARLTDDAMRRFATRKVLTAGAVLAGVAVVLTSWVPAPPSSQVNADVPTFFSSDVARVLPANSRAILLPAPTQNDDSAVLYQAVASMRFSMLGSYAISIANSGAMASHASPDPLTAASSDSASELKTAAASIRRQVISDGVTVVLLVPGPSAASLLATAQAVFGQPRRVGGVDVWQTSSNS